MSNSAPTQQELLRGAKLKKAEAAARSELARIEREEAIASMEDEDYTRRLVAQREQEERKKEARIRDQYE